MRHLARVCEAISITLHVLTLVLTIRAVRSAPEPPAKPVTRQIPCRQEAVFNSYGTSDN